MYVGQHYGQYALMVPAAVGKPSHVSHFCQGNNVPPLPHLIVTGYSPAGHMGIILCLAIDLPPAYIVQGQYVYTADLLQLATV